MWTPIWCHLAFDSAFLVNEVSKANAFFYFCCAARTAGTLVQEEHYWQGTSFADNR